jgi:hypothetical protein
MSMRCAQCRELLSPNDTVAFAGDEVVHLDCRRPRGLSHDERALLFRYCSDHAVATCAACGQAFRQHELGADFLLHRTHLCPRCRADLIDGVRGHLYKCVVLPEELRRTAREAREAATRLIKQAREAHDRADVLQRENEVLKQEARAAVAALREAMRRSHGGP